MVSDGVFAEVRGGGAQHACDPGLLADADADEPLGEALFQPTRAPTVAELADVAMAIEDGVRRYLTRRANQQAKGDYLADTQTERARQALQRLAHAKPVAERTTSGEGPASTQSKRAPAKLAARSPAGFDVHAGVAIPAHGRAALEKLLAYLARPPVPASRLRLLKNGNVTMDLKRTWARGVKTLEFQPLAFIARLAALMPPPKFPMLRYLGVISAHARLRPLVHPEPPQETPERPVSPTRPGALTWRQLLARTFGLRVTECPCGGTFRFIAVIEEPNAIQLVAGAIIASGHLPRHRAPRGPPRRAKDRPWSKGRPAGVAATRAGRPFDRPPWPAFIPAQEENPRAAQLTRRDPYGQCRHPQRSRFARARELLRRRPKLAHNGSKPACQHPCVLALGYKSIGAGDDPEFNTPQRRREPCA